MQTLSSYVLGAWQTGSGEARTLVDPTTGEVVAEASSGGLDFEAVVRHGREVGGPALRAMTFGERGRMLKALSAALHGHREELIELAVRNGGNTRGDAKFDIDGATGTLAAYAHFAKSLPDSGHLPDGEGVQLGRTARFWGQHVRVPRPGVAVHINAFNFPAWGMFEKAACAWLAGVPVISKPGTPTALLAWRAGQIVVAEGGLPEGAFQLVCGGAGDLLDHLGPQDAVAFTGSAATAARIRANENLVRHNVRVNLEADSINAAVLAPDVDSDAESYGTFLTNVATDMTQKAGQKCTAVRRILVPADRVAQVRDDLLAELERFPQGDPAVKGVRVGPVTDSRQLGDVRAGIERLAAHGEIACGGSEPVGEAGCFVAPTLLVARDARQPEFHDAEVFGPVATLLPYSGEVSEAIELTNLGGGGLVCSVYSNDGPWTAEFVAGIAPWHGRIWIGSDRTAGQALAPGMVLPASIHGGPGRAGGGEELGALRGLEFYTQRVALQGFKGLLEAEFGADQ
jgi:phenylacetic acid degradation protein PaaN